LAWLRVRPVDMSAAQSTSSTAGGWAPTRRKNAASSDRRTPKSDGPRARHDRAAAAPSTPGPASNRSQQSRTLRRPLTARWAGLADEEQQAIVMSTLSAHFNDAARSRPWQADAALRLLRGTHVLIVAPTNSGKSRPAEMLSLFLRKGQIVVIICPLLSLCQDVVRRSVLLGRPRALTEQWAGPPEGGERLDGDAHRHSDLP
jgi:hypothetical protein